MSPTSSEILIIIKLIKHNFSFLHLGLNHSRCVAHTLSVGKKEGFEMTFLFLCLFPVVVALNPFSDAWRRAVVVNNSTKFQVGF